VSFLAPLYLLAALAIGVPILLHMIRRAPQGKRLFSSTLFLSPDPPRMTRRSRIENWLLLLFRALAICLLAFAFARPFLRTQLNAEVPQASAFRYSVLVDVSASLQRDGCWQQVQQALRQFAKKINDTDSVSLTIFDSDIQEILSFEEWETLPPSSRQAVFLERVDQIQPGWQGTQAGQALMTVAGRLDQTQDERQKAKTLVLLSDLQAGGGWDALNGFSWPKNVTLRLLPVTPTDPSNGAIQLALDDQAHPDRIRIRITNSADSGVDSYQLGWSDPVAAERGIDPTTTALSVTVPPGQSRVVPMPLDPTDPVRSLVLVGDPSPFDNICRVAMKSVQSLRVVFFGDPAEPQGPENLRFFLNPLFPPTATRTVHIVNWSSGNAPPEPELPISWLLIGGHPDETQSKWIREWIQAGNTALFVFTSPEQGLAAYQLAGLPPHPVSDATLDGYAMLGTVDLSHPALQQFRDPRYSDFTKIHFWKHRTVSADSFPGARILAAFDDGAPALFEIPVGNGTLQLLTSGWNRGESDFAVSSKFVPLMNGLLEQAAPATFNRSQKFVGESLNLEDLSPTGKDQYGKQGEREFTIPAGTDFRFDRPGIYRFAAEKEELVSEQALIVAVNLSPEESRTEPIPLADLSAITGEMTVVTTFAAAEPAGSLSPEQSVQLMNMQLEARQQWWRWLIVATLVALTLESLLAVRKTLGRRGPAPAT